MKLSWRVELPQLLVIAAMFAVAVWAWPQVPEQLPVHWNLQGEVDRWSGKFEGLLLVPFLAVGLYLLMLIVPRIDPGRANYSSFAKAYSANRIAFVLFMAAVHGVMLFTAFGYSVNIPAVLMSSAAVLFVVIGNFMGKIRPNWFVGVRTPWTLSSKLSWNKTHRLAGWLFMLMGLLFVVLAVAPSPLSFAAVLAIDAACLIWMVVYSYLVYRRDPDRLFPAGTSPGGE